jgi:hypothetical protein
MRVVASALLALSLLAGAAGSASAEFNNWPQGGVGPPTYWTQQDTSKSPH